MSNSTQAAYFELEAVQTWARRRKEAVGLLGESPEFDKGWVAALDDLLATLAKRQQDLA